MIRRLTVAQVACGLVAGVGIALGATGGLMVAASLYGGRPTVLPIVAASSTGSRAQPALKAARESGQAAETPLKKAAPKRAAVARKHATRADTRSRPRSHVKRRSAPTLATVLVRQTAPATTTAPKQLAQAAPLTTPKPARQAPSKPTARPTRSASGSGRTFDDSG
jgi:hypothetical protein